LQIKVKIVDDNVIGFFCVYPVSLSALGIVVHPIIRSISITIDGPMKKIANTKRKIHLLDFATR
jgi:hypothetical protein